MTPFFCYCRFCIETRHFQFILSLSRGQPEIIHTELQKRLMNSRHDNTRDTMFGMQTGKRLKHEKQ